MLPDKHQISRQFSRSAARYGDFDSVQRLMNDALLEWLPDYHCLVDLGCGDGRTLRQLAARHPQRSHLALDLAPGMLAEVRRHRPNLPCLQADMERLPLATAGLDLIYSCAALQWTDAARVFAEVQRTLRPGGTLLLGTLVEGSLREWQQAWTRADRASRVHALPNPDQLLAQLEAAGLQIELQRRLEYRYDYDSAATMLRDLKGLGGTHADPGRPRGLLGRQTYARFCAALEELGCVARYQVLLIKAGKA